MRTVPFGAALFTGALALSCGGSAATPVTPTAAATTDISTSTPAPAAVPPGPCTIGFDGLSANGAAFATHTACGLTVTGAQAAWQASTAYGNPAPFIQFLSPGGTTTTGEVTVQSPDAAFALVSIDIYSSTTKIPFEVTGSLHGAVVFTLRDVQGNTFGRFATVANPHAAAPADALRIRLTNPAAPCCTNPVGLDNIRVVR